MNGILGIGEIPPPNKLTWGRFSPSSSLRKMAEELGLTNPIVFIGLLNVMSLLAI